MIPLRDVIPSRTTPFVTVGLLLINLIIASLFLSGWLTGGASLPLDVDTVSGGTFAWQRFIMAPFLHASLFHLLGNQLVLWIFGGTLEDRLGHGRFLIFYLLAGSIASLIEIWQGPASAGPLLGASGAAAGVMSAYFVLFPRSRILVLVPIPFVFDIIEVPATVPLLLWLLLQLAGGFGSPGGPASAAVWSLAGGFATGFALVWVFRRRERERVEWWDGFN